MLSTGADDAGMMIEGSRPVEATSELCEVGGTSTPRERDGSGSGRIEGKIPADGATEL